MYVCMHVVFCRVCIKSINMQSGFTECKQHGADVRWIQSVLNQWFKQLLEALYIWDLSRENVYSHVVQRIVF